METWTDFWISCEGRGAMNKKEFLENLKRLGFSLMETTKGVDVAQTLAQVVKSNDARMWEGFPVLLANAAEEYGFDYDQTLKSLTDNRDREHFRGLVLLSLALYKHFHLSFFWATRLMKNFSSEDVAAVKELGKSVAQGSSIPIGNTLIDPSRLKTIFNNYFEKDVKRTADKKIKHEELSLEYALSQLFSPKQKELFKKKLNGDALTKTEKEYYSRVVKKKVAALANPELNRLAQKLMEF